MMLRKRAASPLRYTAPAFLVQVVVLLRALKWNKTSAWISAPALKSRVPLPRGGAATRGAAAVGGSNEPSKPKKAKPAEAEALSLQHKSQGLKADMQQGLQEQAQKAFLVLLLGLWAFLVVAAAFAAGFVGDRVQEQRVRIVKDVEAAVDDVVSAPGRLAQAVVTDVSALPKYLILGAQTSVSDAGATLGALLKKRGAEIGAAIVSTPEVAVNDVTRFATQSLPNFFGRIFQSRAKQVGDSTKRFADDIGQAPGRVAQVTGAKVKEAVQGIGTATTVVFIEAPTARVKAAVKSTGQLVQDVQSAPSVLSRKIADVLEQTNRDVNAAVRVSSEEAVDAVKRFPSDAIDEAKKIPDRLVSFVKDVPTF